MARPTEYDPKFCEEIIEYFRSDEILGTLAGFSAKIGISRQTLHTWTQTHPEFLDAVEKCKVLQESKLIEGGLRGSYASSFAMFVAKNYCGLRDKGPDEPPDVSVQVNNVQVMTDKEIDERLAKLLAKKGEGDGEA